MKKRGGRYSPDSAGQAGMDMLLKFRVLGSQVRKIRRLVFVSVPRVHRLAQGHPAEFGTVTSGQY